LKEEYLFHDSILQIGKSYVALVNKQAYIIRYIADNKIMRTQILKKRSFLIAIIMVLSLLASASYSVAMPLIMASSECATEVTPCDMCCLMGQSAQQLVLHEMSLISLLAPLIAGVPDSIPLPFYHPPG